MKIFMNRILLLLTLSSSVALIQSCKEDISLQPTTIESNEVLESIKDAGFTVIEDMGDYYLVEGDIYFPKNEIYQTRQPTSNGRANHYRARYIASEPYNITVRVDASIPTSGVDNWRSALSKAINDWNTLESTNIFFKTTTSSSAKVTITSDNGSLPSGVLATSTLPNSSGAPGPTIRINLDYNDNKEISESQKRHQLVHELGHTLGIRHTDWDTLGEARDGAMHIPETPEGINDLSVMTSFQRTGLRDWDRWREYDPITAQYLFPQPHLYAIKDWGLYAINDLTGTSYAINTSNFTGFQAMVALYGYETRLFVIKNGNFYILNRKTGETTQVGPSGFWTNVKAMTATGGLNLGGNQIYAINESALRIINPETGSFTGIGGVNDWPNTKVLSSYLVSPGDGQVKQGLFGIVGDALYGIKVPHSVQNFPGNTLKAFINNSTSDWTAAQAMVCIPDGKPMNYIMASNTLYKVGEFAGGTFTRLGSDNEWPTWTFMTAFKKNLYIINAGTLFEFNTTTNTKRQLGAAGAWIGTSAIVSAPNNVKNPQ